MEISNKEGLIGETVSRVINNAPVSELLRVYAESLRAHISGLSDEELIQSIQNAGYEDLIEEYVSTTDAA